MDCPKCQKNFLYYPSDLVRAILVEVNDDGKDRDRLKYDAVPDDYSKEEPRPDRGEYAKYAW